MIIDKDNFELLIEALDFWVKDSVLPVIPKNRISVRKPILGLLTIYAVLRSGRRDTKLTQLRLCVS